jgi:hypothetical protein
MVIVFLLADRMGTISYTAEKYVIVTLSDNPRICLVDPNKESKSLKVMIPEIFMNIIKLFQC